LLLPPLRVHQSCAFRKLATATVEAKEDDEEDEQGCASSFDTVFPLAAEAKEAVAEAAAAASA
jgi:hypothetical protein